MIDVTLSVLALFAGGLTLEMYAAARAPLGYQDERGFHLGTEAQEPAEGRPSENPS
jgi:hypothetical protein